MCVCGAILGCPLPTDNSCGHETYLRHQACECYCYAGRSAHHHRIGHNRAYDRQAHRFILIINSSPVFTHFESELLRATWLTPPVIRIGDM